jgi:hypothetical protein
MKMYQFSVGVPPALSPLAPQEEPAATPRGLRAGPVATLEHRRRG